MIKNYIGYWYYTLFVKCANLSDEELKSTIDNSSIPENNRQEAFSWIKQHAITLPNRAIHAIIGNLQYLFGFEELPKPLLQINSPAELDELVRSTRREQTRARPSELQSALTVSTDALKKAWPQLSEEDILDIYPLVLADLQKVNHADIPERYKPLAVQYVKNLLLKDPRNISDPNYQGNVDYARNLYRDIEKFYLYSRYIPQSQRDLNKIDFMVLKDLVEEAQEAAKNDTGQTGAKYKAKVKEGLQKLGEDEEWEVYSPHNKESACHIGAGTTWCTAARGENNAFSEYYSPDDQLYVFINKKNPTEKYQFHYGTEQFMDKNDHSIGNGLLVDKLHGLLDGLLEEKQKTNNFKWIRDKEKIIKLKQGTQLIHQDYDSYDTPWGIEEREKEEKRKKELADSVNNTFIDIHGQNLDDENVKKRLSWLISVNPLLIANMEPFELSLVYDKSESNSSSAFPRMLMNLMDIANGEETVDPEHRDNASVAALTLLEWKETVNFKPLLAITSYLIEKNSPILQQKGWQQIAELLLVRAKKAARSEEGREEVDKLEQQYMKD